MHPLVSLVKEKEVLLPCEHPVLTENNGRVYAQACGKCRMCMEKKAQIWRIRLKQECEDNRFCIFFTLTYDNINVPFFQPAKNFDGYVLDGAQGYQFKGDDFVSYSKRLSVPYKDCGNVLPVVTNFDVCNSFAVVSRTDVQKFLKRFRWHLQHLLTKHYKLKFYDQLFHWTRQLGYDGTMRFEDWLSDLDDDTYTIYSEVYQYYKNKYEKEKEQAKQVTRYFICSEYTPSTFRPHYHGLFWFENEKAYQFAFRCIRKAWTLCHQRNIDVQPVTGNAYAYVAKYVTGNLNLPKVLRVKSTRTFCLASKGPAIGYKSFSSERVREMYNQRNIFRSIETVTKQGKQVNVYVVSPSVVSRYFPKCYQYSQVSSAHKFRVYTRFIKIRKDGNVEKIDVPASLACLQWYKENTHLYPRRTVDELGDSMNAETPWFHSADINAARACLRWCIKYDCHPNHYIAMLDWFHNEYAQYNLYQQYRYMERLQRVARYRADEYYSKDIDVRLDDVKICIDFTFLACLPFYLQDAINRPDLCSIAESYGIHISNFYYQGLLSRDKVNKYYEYNQKHFADYRQKVYDRLILADKTKKANSSVLEEVY